MPVKDKIDTIVRTGLDPALSARGFRTSRKRYARRHGRTEQLLWIERSSWNRGEDGRFAVWVGVTFDEMGASVSRPDFLCPIHAIASDAPAQFEVDAAVDPELAAEELQGIVIDGVIKPLELVASLGAFVALGWAPAMPWGFAARMAYHLGDDAEAASLIAREAGFFADRGVTEAELIARYRLDRLRN